MTETISTMLSKMTLNEKILMLIGASSMGTAGCERLDVPSAMCTDGPLGVRIEKQVEKDCTAFPCGASIAATWNRELVEQVGVGIANDCIRNDKDIILGPGVNIKRTPLCGRNFEYYSEDPVLAGKIASAYIRGVQSQGVGACVKHFAANNQELYRGTASVDIDERTLRDLYLKPFEIAVKESDPASVMLAYNRINGVLCVENPYLLQTVLREDWHYSGIALSDWYGVRNPVTSLLNGLNLQMPYQVGHGDMIKQAVAEGRVTEEQIDEAISPLLDFLMTKKKKTISYDRDWQHTVAKDTATEGIVLLKNRNRTLPITPEKYKSIVVIGGYAETPVYYGYGSARVYPQPWHVDSPIEKIKKNLDGQIEVTYVKGYDATVSSEASIFDWRPDFTTGAGGNCIQNADLVVMFLGQPFGTETEDADLGDPHLFHYYNSFIGRVQNLNKNIVIVLQTGEAIVPHAWNDMVPAVVQMWMAGEGGGSAIADVLCGKVSPSGKLPETFAKKVRYDLDYPGNGTIIRYDEKWAVGYRYYDQHPDEIAYPFGHGLSYTEFEYRDFAVKRQADQLVFSFCIQNIGVFPAKEIVQLYVSKPESYISRPKKELLEFHKTKELKGGEGEQVELTIPVDDLGYFNCNLRKKLVESGVYVFSLGASSTDIRLQVAYEHTDTNGFTMSLESYTALG